MVRDAAGRGASASTPTARVRSSGPGSARHGSAATGVLRVCCSNSKAKNENCHRN